MMLYNINEKIFSPWQGKEEGGCEWNKLLAQLACSKFLTKMF